MTREGVVRCVRIHDTQRLVLVLLGGSDENFRGRGRRGGAGRGGVLRLDVSSRHLRRDEAHASAVSGTGKKDLKTGEGV